MMEEFETWISNKLRALEYDDTVIIDYIKGIVSGDESQDEQQEALEGILGGVMETGVDEFCQDIFAKWRQLNSTHVSDEVNGATANKVNWDDQLSKIMEQHNIDATVNDKPRAALRDNDVKAAILKQYAEISDGDEDEEEEDRTEMKNTNRDEVAREEQERRERLKAEATAKRERDKQDREKQKAQQVERKEKEKKRTVKGEKRR